MLARRVRIPALAAMRSHVLTSAVEDFGAVRSKALKLGAVDMKIADLKRELQPGSELASAY